ncbi:MAG: hypothetical protein LBI13_07385 [Streptococcaceae bacterium]|nr:hypothetical protein [Streptococcaceae bacterium]
MKLGEILMARKSEKFDKHKVQLYRMSNKVGNHNFEAFLAMRDLENGSYYLVDNTRPFISWLITPLKNKFSYPAYEIDEATLSSQVTLYDHKWTSEENNTLSRKNKSGVAFAISYPVSILFQGVFLFLGLTITRLIPITTSRIVNNVFTTCLIILTVCATTFGWNMSKRLYIKHCIKAFGLIEEKPIKVQGEIFGITKWTYMKWYWAIFVGWLIMILPNVSYTAQKVRQGYTYTVILSIVFTSLSIFFTDWRGPTYAQKVKHMGEILPNITLKIWRED